MTYKIRIDKRIINGSAVDHIYISGKFAGTIRRIRVGKNQWTDEENVGTHSQMVKAIKERYLKNEKLLQV